MKKTKQTTAVILSLVLLLSTVLGQLPASIRATAASYGISNPRTDSSGVTTWDCIWFGNYWQSSKTTKEPIKWRVLSVDGDDAFLLADQNLDCQRYNTEDTSVTWETCSLRTWLNTTFYQNAFSSAEQAAIRTTTVINENNPSSGTKGGNDTQDKVYLLSIAEASSAAYGFDSTFDKESETRCSKNTEYAKGQGAGYAGNGTWWLRSPGLASNTAADVSGNGLVYINGHVNNPGRAVRPVLHIDLSSSPWSKAGTVGSSGGSAGGVTASPIPTANPSTTPAGTSYGISNPRTDSSGTTTWDCIWFGNYLQSNKTAKEPIKWRVLSVDGDDAFLVADQNLDCQPYHTENRSVTWETCSLRTWLNTTFYQNAFSSAEQAAIRTTTVINEDNPYHKTEGGNDTQDKVYLLSIAEASNAAYGFNSAFDKESKTGCSKNTEYAKGQGAYTSTIDGYAGNGWWWLRSPGYDVNNVVYMSNTGWGNDKGPYVTSVGYAVRPVLHINLSSSTWRKAGTVSSSGGSAGGVTASPVPTAQPSATPSGTSYGISNPRTDSSGTTTWDCIWFGNYWQSSETVKEPIKWRVLLVDGDDAFLLADQNLDAQPYNTHYTYVTWETCSLRTWLNTTFYQNAFSSTEQAVIRTTTVVNEDNPEYGTEGGNDTQDKVYLLSIAEASNAAYGFNSTFDYDKVSETRYSKNSEYAKGQGPYTSTSGSYAGNGYWWLRSLGYVGNFAAYVNCAGQGSNGGNDNDACYAVRPALHIDLSSSTWSKAGTVSSSGGSAGGVTASPMLTVNPSAATAETPMDTSPISSPTPLPTQQTDNKDKKDSTIVLPSKNTRLEDSQGAVYTVTKSGSSKGEVEYTAPKNKKVTSATIPATVNLKGITYKVTSIKANAFKNCKKLKKVTIGKNIKTLGKNAFNGCAKLNTITIKTTKLTNKSVGNKAFAKIHKKAKLKVPKKKLSAYKKLLKKKGVTGKNQVIKK